jgi:glycolate oxidase FAD binding subunit
VDRQNDILEQVTAAIEAKSPIAIRGGDTKSFYGHPAEGEPLDLAGHEGVVDYDPGELVMTCRAGTRLSVLRELLAENGQHLPFEPPGYGEDATIGGTVACGFSGPARPWAGSLRDYLLGVKIINGRGKVLRFGGQVMKNVAGYDVSRLMAGAMGTLGVLLEVSFKVLPRPAKELTLAFHCGQDEAIQRMTEWSGQPLPLSAASWQDGTLRVRLSGAASETDRAAGLMQAEADFEDTAHWRDLREHLDPFFADTGPLWRLSVPATSKPFKLAGDCFLDWGGAQRWVRTDESPDRVREAAEDAGGHATFFRGDAAVPRFHPLPPAMQELQKRVRQAFDPLGLFNPGRLGPDR